MPGMRRREFVSLLGGAAAAWPLAARAQQPAMPVIGFLNASVARRVRTVARVPPRPQGNRLCRGQKRCDRISLGRGSIRSSARAGGRSGSPSGDGDRCDRRAKSGAGAKAATATIPIVFTGGADPVGHGLVASLNRPGGNATGIINASTELEAKRLELLHEMAPQVVAIGLLVNPAIPDTETVLKQVQNAARTLGLELHVQKVSAENDFDAAFATFIKQRIGALFVGNDALFHSRREQIVALAKRHSLPAMYFFREFVAIGGLMSYATNITDGYRQAGVYAAEILKGAKPADLPVSSRPSSSWSSISRPPRRSASTVPPTLLARADEVIE